MKGLIIKDILCMKKQLTMFTYITVSVLVLSVMFALSANYGNIHTALYRTMAENNVTESDILNMFTYALLMFMIMPPACVCDPTPILVEDRKAGFINVAAALPIRTSKRVLSKYLSIYSLFAIGFIVDVIISAILSNITTLFTFGYFMNMILFLFGLVEVVAAFTFMYYFLLGNGNEIFANILAAVTIFAVLFAFIFKTATKMGTDEEAFEAIMSLPREKGYLFFVIALVIVVLSYFVNVYIANKKRGVV